jgi:ABC-type branched-subunit amino acid transport system ATPase component
MKDGKGTKVSRRNFLKLSGVTAAGAAGVLGGGRIVFHGTPGELEARADIKKEHMGV